MDLDEYLNMISEDEYHPKEGIEFHEITPGLFYNRDKTVITTDDYYKLPQYILDKFGSLDKKIHRVIKQTNVVMKVEGSPDRDGVKVTNSRLQDACYTKDLFNWVNSHEDVKLYLIGMNGVLLAEHDTHFSIIAPYISEEVV